MTAVSIRAAFGWSPQVAMGGLLCARMGSERSTEAILAMSRDASFRHHRDACSQQTPQKAHHVCRPMSHTSMSRSLAQSAHRTLTKAAKRAYDLPGACSAL